ncbi:MAG: AMP-binding protein, partial [Legionellales bacterium]
VDFGITLAGMVSVPLYSNQHEESIHYVLEHAEIQLVFVGKLDDSQRVRGYIPSAYKTVSFEYHKNLKVDHHWSEVMACDPLVEVIEPQPDDLYTIIYSSGTTGSPKGAMYTHKAIAYYLEVFPKDLNRFNDSRRFKLISYLPLAHVYERSAIELSSLVINADVSFVESLDKFAKNLQEIQPILFTAVPRIWGVFQQKIEQKMSPTALNILLKIPFVSAFIKKRIKHGLGFSEVSNFFSGASYLPISIIQFFDKLGIYIQDGYGQTENLAYATVSLLSDRKLGYVGTPRLGVEIKLSEDDELLVYSSCLMSGYYKDKQATKNAFTSEGYLRTGDIAELDALGRVKILGRVSEIFKNQTGEFVSPTPIEKKFTTLALIDQLCLVGRGLPSNVLIITLNEAAAASKTKEAIITALQNRMRKVNGTLVKFEKISHIIIVKSAWTPENNLLTPTLKVKRRVVEQYYADLIDHSLTLHQSVVWE